MATAKKDVSKRSLTKMPAYYPEINRRIAWLRESRDMTYEDMSHQTGINYSTLAAIEQERTNPNIHVLRQVVKVFKVPYEWLIDGRGPTPVIEPKKSLEAKVRALEETVKQLVKQG